MVIIEANLRQAERQITPRWLLLVFGGNWRPVFGGIGVALASTSLLDNLKSSIL